MLLFIFSPTLLLLLYLTRNANHSFILECVFFVDTDMDVSQNLVGELTPNGFSGCSVPALPG